MRIWFGLTCALFLFTTCKKGHRMDCVKSAGEIVTEVFELESFTKLHIKDKFDVELVYAPNEVPKMEVRFNKNLMVGVPKKVENGELFLQDNNRCNWVRNFNVQPFVKLYYDDSLRELMVEGAAKVYNKDTMRVRNLFITHIGIEDIELTVWGVYGMECNAYNSGGFKIKGFAGYIAATLDDIATIDLSELILDDLYLFYYSLRSSRVRSREIMAIELYGRGDVYIDELPADSSRARCCKVSLKKLGEGEFK